MSVRKACFKHVEYDLAGLLRYIDGDGIGLPDIHFDRDGICCPRLSIAGR